MKFLALFFLAAAVFAGNDGQTGSFISIDY